MQGQRLHGDRRRLKAPSLDEVEKAKVVDTPRAKMTKKTAVAAKASPLLGPVGAASFGGTTVRAGYFSQELIDISEAMRCLARHMARPTEASMVQAKRLARHLKAKPRCFLVYKRGYAAHIS